jgi:hypothetical protein
MRRELKLDVLYAGVKAMVLALWPASPLYDKMTLPGLENV